MTISERQGSALSYGSDGAINPSELREFADLLDALVAALEDIANSDDIDNALDPERNKRVARAFLISRLLTASRPAKAGNRADGKQLGRTRGMGLMGTQRGKLMDHYRRGVLITFVVMVGIGALAKWIGI